MYVCMYVCIVGVNNVRTNIRVLVELVPRSRVNLVLGCRVRVRVRISLLHLRTIDTESFFTTGCTTGYGSVAFVG